MIVQLIHIFDYYCTIMKKKVWNLRKFAIWNLGIPQYFQNALGEQWKVTCCLQLPVWQFLFVQVLLIEHLLANISEKIAFFMPSLAFRKKTVEISPSGSLFLENNGYNQLIFLKQVSASSFCQHEWILAGACSLSVENAVIECVVLCENCIQNT